MVLQHRLQSRLVPLRLCCNLQVPAERSVSRVPSRPSGSRAHPTCATVCRRRCDCSARCPAAAQAAASSPPSSSQNAGPGQRAGWALHQQAPFRCGSVAIGACLASLPLWEYTRPRRCCPRQLEATEACAGAATAFSTRTASAPALAATTCPCPSLLLAEGISCPDCLLLLRTPAMPCRLRSALPAPARFARLQSKAVEEHGPMKLN